MKYCRATKMIKQYGKRFDAVYNETMRKLREHNDLISRSYEEGNLGEVTISRTVYFSLQPWYSQTWRICEKL